MREDVGEGEDVHRHQGKFTRGSMSSCFVCSSVDQGKDGDMDEWRIEDREGREQDPSGRERRGLGAADRASG